MTQYTFDEHLTDLYKDALGSRPGDGFWRHWNESTLDEKQAIWDGLSDLLEQELERERKAEEQAVANFEHQVRSNMELGAADRQQAIRWIIESLDPSEVDMMYGCSWVCWELGLPYSMEGEFKEVCRELLDGFGSLAETTCNGQSHRSG